MRKWNEVDRELVKLMPSYYKWIVRDDNGEIWFYKEEPYRNHMGYWDSRGIQECLDLPINNTIFSAIRCNDKAPVLVKDVLDGIIHHITDMEKVFLKEIIKPFLNDIKYIRKVEYENEECIELILNNYEIKSSISFEKEMHFRGMDCDDNYTLEMLGLL